MGLAITPLFNEVIMNISANDIYGSNAASIVGVNTPKTDVAASASVGSLTEKSNEAFSWVGFVAVLVLIRVFEMMLPEG